MTPGRRAFFDDVNRAALASFSILVARWLPDGRREGNEWTARNPRRADRRPGSFKVNLRTGRWADFATGDKGGDPISLAAYLGGLSQTEAARRLADCLGIRQ
jgi:hypothetical protein